MYFTSKYLILHKDQLFQATKTTELVSSKLPDSTKPPHTNITPTVKKSKGIFLANAVRKLLLSSKSPKINRKPTYCKKYDDAQDFLLEIKVRNNNSRYL